MLEVFLNFPVQTEKTRLIRHLLYGFWFIFYSVYSAVFVFRCCRLTYLRACWFRFMFTPVRHSFASLIDKQLSRKTTLMLQNVLLLELFHKNISNPLLFSSKSAQTFSRQNLPVWKKAYCSLTAPGRAIRFFQPISVRHDLKTSSVI